MNDLVCAVVITYSPHVITTWQQVKRAPRMMEQAKGTFHQGQHIAQNLRGLCKTGVFGATCCARVWWAVVNFTVAYLGSFQVHPTSATARACRARTHIRLCHIFMSFEKTIRFYPNSFVFVCESSSMHFCKKKHPFRMIARMKCSSRG